MMRVYIGTSGYNYPEWRGSFYPADFPAKKMFGFYSEQFRTVEINYTFYRMPTLKTTEAWRAQAPEGFSYVLKAPRRITHDKRLKDCADTLQFFCESAGALGPHLGPLLFQLPPHFKCDVGRLREFLTLLPDDMRAAFEFRHETWLTDEVYAALRDRGVALCIAEAATLRTPALPTARYGYLRLRDERYQADDLARWADTVAGHQGDWDDVWVFFKHEEEARGPEFARAFRALVEARGVTLA
jgi:uncharacterized protein YecE (DUF72 family)